MERISHSFPPNAQHHAWKWFSTNCVNGAKCVYIFRLRRRIRIIELHCNIAINFACIIQILIVHWVDTSPTGISIEWIFNCSFMINSFFRIKMRTLLTTFTGLLFNVHATTCSTTYYANFSMESFLVLLLFCQFRVNNRAEHMDHFPHSREGSKNIIH